MQIWAESGKSALPICNYSQILYQFLTFTQNLKRSPYQLIFEYLEAFYNTKRIHSHCNYMSPNEFERVYERTHTEAELLAG